jgi:uncharacterized protein YqcC (DUF446 family)
MAIAQQLDSLLETLEQAMIAAGEWSDNPPEAAAFQSVEPFCIDTMTLSQWLQFIMLPRFRLMIAESQPLPGNCAIAPVAEENYAANSRAREIILVLQQIDKLLSQPR